MNIPNILSLVRLGMVPVVPLLYFSGVSYANWLAAVVYGLASLTDILDGYIARRFNMITRLGRVLDPMADKLMSFTVLVCIVISGSVPVWAAVVFFTKEALMSFGALVQYKKIADVPPSHPLGKFSTVFFFSVCFLVMVLEDIAPPLAVTISISVALALNIAAFLIYLSRYITLVKKKK